MMPISRLFRCPAILMAILITGCATSPTYTFYTLSAMQAADPTPGAVYRGDDATTIAVSSVSFPSYLDRPQIVTRPTAHTLAIHELRRWGGSLEGDFVRVLGENLSILLDTQRVFLPRQKIPFAIDYRIAIDIKQFDGNPGEQVVLDADWMIIAQANKEHVVIRKSVIRETVKSHDYESLVSAKSQAVEKLSREIADAFRKIQSNINE